MISVASIHVYPVKSCRGIAATSWPVEARGLRHDRRFMIVGPDGGFVTQRELPELALVTTAIDLVSGRLQLRFGGEEREVPLEPDGPSLQVRVWRDDVRAVAVDSEVDRWLSAALGRPLRLVYFPSSTHRAVDARYAAGSETGFADGFPLLVVSQASLDDLNRRLSSPVPMDRFRPNLVFAGAEPFAEDTWQDVDLGEVAIRIVKPCARCVIVTTDQATAERSPEPLRTLSTYRRQNHDVLFGQNAIVLRPGTLHGDTLPPAKQSKLQGP